MIVQVRQPLIAQVNPLQKTRKIYKIITIASILICFLIACAVLINFKKENSLRQLSKRSASLFFCHDPHKETVLKIELEGDEEDIKALKNESCANSTIETQIISPEVRVFAFTVTLPPILSDPDCMR